MRLWRNDRSAGRWFCAAATVLVVALAARQVLRVLLFRPRFTVNAAPLDRLATADVLADEEIDEGTGNPVAGLARPTYDERVPRAPVLLHPACLAVDRCSAHAT
jgi:hypothetical protein